MVRLQAKLSSKNQITVPARVRQTLGVGALDRLDFVIDGDTVTVEPVRLTMADIFQSVPPLKIDGRSVLELELEELMDLNGEAERINAFRSSK